MQTDEQILHRLDVMAAQLGELAERQRAKDELWEEAVPVLREALATAIVQLDTLDKQGHFAFLAELARVGRRVVEGFTPADVRELGDSIVAILDVARALTRPEVLQIARDAAGAMHDASGAAPMGALRAVRATRDADVKKGLGLMVDLLRRVGHGVRTSAERDTKALDRKEKLAELLAPRRARMLPAHAAAAPTSVAAARANGAPQNGATRSDGHLADPGSWTRAVAETVAREQGFELDEPRWALVDAARSDFASMHASPNIQRLTQVAGITTKDLYRLFPKAPARTIAKIAGLPKPAGCL